MEIWRDIDGYEGLYQVSNIGRVKRFYKAAPPRILKAALSHGYLCVSLHRDNKSKMYMIHRLVALAFIDNPESKPQINHINGIKTDNRTENLEWCTGFENVRHAFVTGLRGTDENHSRAKLTNEQVRFIRDNPDSLTINQLAELFNVMPVTISAIQLGRHYRNAGGAVRTAKLLDPKRISDDVREQIRHEYIFGSREFGSRALARKYGVSQPTILNIIHEGGD